MSKVVKVSEGDYKIVTQLNGTITLDTGNQIGQVVVTGDLVVRGNTTTIDSETLTVRDNIIYLNVDETGAGVTLDTAGILIERGSLPDAGLLFDENIPHIPPSGSPVQGTFKFVNSLGSLIGLQINSLTTGGGDLNIFTGTIGSGAISVSNVPDYENRITSDDDIPNRKWVTDYVVAAGGAALVDRFYRYNGLIELDTGGRAYDSDAADGPSRIEFEVDNVLETTIDSSGILVNNIRIGDNTVTTLNNQLTLTANNNVVDVNAVITLNDQGSDPSSTLTKNTIYSKTAQSIGATGLYFVNDNTSGELISGRRSLVYSIIF